MGRMRTCIAITILSITIALSVIQVNANLYAQPSNGVLPGFGTDTTIISPPTQAQKEEAIKIASTSPLCKQYNAYPNESWNFGWDGHPPADNIINLMTELPDSNFLEIVVDLNTDSIVSATIEPPMGTDYAYPVNSTDTDAPATGAPSIMPFQLGSLMGFPASTTGFNLFSSGLTGHNAIGSTPVTDMSSVGTAFPSTTAVSLPLASLYKGGLGEGYGTNGQGIYAQKSSTATSSAADPVLVPQDKKDEALKIAATSPVCKEYNQYPDGTWECEWAKPYDGHTMKVSHNFGEFVRIIMVDLNTGTIVSEGNRSTYLKN